MSMRVLSNDAFRGGLFPVVRLMIRDVLNRPLDRPWSVQGFGMLRTYFGSENTYRLNVWDNHLAVRNVSIIHDHPWDFQSWIFSGLFSNVRFLVARRDYNGSPHALPACAPNYLCQTIKTGEGGGPIGEPTRVFLQRQQPEMFRRGDTYAQYASEVHASYFDNGTVTLNERTNRKGEDANVFWPINARWVSAEPRPATEEEIWATTRRALDHWES